MVMPHRTFRAWNLPGIRPIFGMEYAQELRGSLELAKQFVQNQKVQKVYRAYTKAKSIVTKLFVKILKLVSFDVKRKIINAVERFRNVLSFKKILRLFSITVYKFHMEWGYRMTFFTTTG